MDLRERIHNLLRLMGFPDAEVTVENEHHKISIIVDDELVRANIATILPAAEHLINLMAHRDNHPTHVVDVSYYRRERERLIVELAKAAEESGDY